MSASTKKSGFARMQRVSLILAKRYSGKSLADIGAEENPPVSAQNIHALIQRALGLIRSKRSPTSGFWSAAGLI